MSYRGERETRGEHNGFLKGICAHTFTIGHGHNEFTVVFWSARGRTEEVDVPRLAPGYDGITHDTEYTVWRHNAAHAANGGTGNPEWIRESELQLPKDILPLEHQE